MSSLYASTIANSPAPITSFVPLDIILSKYNPTPAPGKSTGALENTLLYASCTLEYSIDPITTTAATAATIPSAA